MTSQDPDYELAVAVLDVLLDVSPRNAKSGTTATVVIRRQWYDQLTVAFERRWPGRLQRARGMKP